MSISEQAGHHITDDTQEGNKYKHVCLTEFY